MTIVVAGASGYVGGRLVAHLRELGRDVLPLVRHPRPWLGDGQVVVDLAHDDVLVDALRGADAVVHLAGLSEVVAATDPDRALSETVVVSRRIADGCVRAGVARVVYVSTVHVYGGAIVPGAVLTEDTRCRPRNPYAIARLASEYLCESHSPELDVVVMRLTNSVGAPAGPDVDRWSLVGNDLCRQAIVEGRIVLRTSGVQHRDFVDLGDVCTALATAAEPSSAIVAGTYNLGSGRPLSVRDLAGVVQQRVEHVTGRRPPIDAPSPSGPAPQPYVVDVSRLASCGVRPTAPIESSIDETVRFCLDHLQELERV